ncbi:MAG: chromosome segregation protein SMC [Clostridium sp.]
MFLKSLEIRGFKSFADKTHLKFKRGVTAVVGPNGSGKSNISDSVRWVLGEQSVKTLRGGKMEDVIFAGTQFRKAVGLAQVSLTLDNADNSLDTDYNEVTVTRRIFRSGESEYLINNQKCRLKDINQLFMDTGIGKEGYSLIGQGKIEAILSGKPEERRNLLEEAAGIVKYKSRKEEAEKKLSNTEDNLVRIRDIISTYEERLEPLRLEREKALKYQELANELKAKEVSLLVDSISKVEDELKLVLSDLDERNKKLNERRLKLDEVKSELANYELQIDELEKKNSIERTEFYSKKEETAQNANDILIFNERIKNIKDLIKKYEDEISESELYIEKLKEEQKALLEELKIKVEEQKENESILFELEKDIKEVNEKVKVMEDELLGLKDDEFGIHQKASELNNSIKIINRDIDIKVDQSQVLKTSIASIEDNISINTATISGLKLSFVNSKEEITKLEENLNESRKNYANYQTNLKRLDRELNNIFAMINKQEANHSMLIDLEKHYEGYNRSVKMLMDKIDKGNIPYATGTKVFGEIFNVKREYEVAIEIALGAAISNVITKDEVVGKKLIEYLKANHLGRATFLPLNIIKGNKLSLPGNITSCDGYIGLASEIVQYDALYRNILEYSLGRTIIAKDMDSALKISKLGNYRYKIVTLTGEVINPGGALTGGSLNGKSTNLLGRKREIEELGEKLKSNKEQKEELISQKQDTIKAIKDMDELILSIREEIHSSQIQLKGTESEINSLVNEVNRLKNSLGVSKNEVISIENHIERLKNEIITKEKSIEEVQGKNSKNKARVIELEEAIINSRKNSEESREKLTEVKVSKATLDEIVSGKSSEIKRRDRDISERVSKINGFKKEISEKNNNINSLNLNIKEKEDNINKISIRIKALEEIFKEDEVKKLEIKEKCKVSESNINELIEIIRKEEGDFSKREIQNAKFESERDNLYSKLNDELNLTLAEAKEMACEISDLHLHKESIYRLKGKITSLGTVNLASIEEYEDVSEKYEFMSTQEKDLESAKQEIVSVISQMTVKMQELFRENFKILNINFNETFKELFKGGNAQLILSEGDELTANIDINVQPPGKKLQNINLMSGGEKVLSAIALLFAILKMKPTPFCILDEIEAALDDANVYRYAEFLRDFSDRIQFIVITHRKGTMEASDVMYGVTMEEKGISKVVSVDLTKNI